MVRQDLEQHNRQLLRELNMMTELVEKSLIPRELEPYRESVIEFCQTLDEFIELNLTYLYLAVCRRDM